MTIASLSGKVLWLRNTSLGANGSSVSSWTDESPHGRDTTLVGTAPTVVTSATPLGTSAVRFVGTGALRFEGHITASSIYNSDPVYHPRTVADSDTGTYWHTHTNTGTHWLKVKQSTASAVTGYSIQCVSSSGPGTWTFDGSNDGTSWTTLDSHTGVTWGATENKSYSFSNSTSYLYYRFEVTSSPAGYCRWSEVTFTGGTLELDTAVRDGELWVVVDSANTTTNGAWEFSSLNQDSHYSFSGVAYETAGGASRASFTPSVAITSWRVYRVRVSGSTRTIYLDGALQSTDTVTRDWALISALGRSITGTYFSGDIAEVVAFDSALGTTDATTVYDELVARHISGPATLELTSPTATATAAASPASVSFGVMSLTSPTAAATAAASPASVTIGLSLTSPTATATASAAPSSVVIAQVVDPWVSGAHGDALVMFDTPPGVLVVEYPATAAPASIVEVPLMRASHQMPALTGVRAMDYDIVTEVVGVPHAWVDGVDVTYFRGAPCKIGGWKQQSPFGWTATTITFPQVFHYEERGTGDLSWMRADAPVEIAIVTPEGAQLHRFTGQLTSDDPGVGRGRTECVWGVEGLLWQSDHAHHPVPARLDPTEVGTLVPDELNGTPSRRWSPIARVATPGVVSRQRGGTQQTRWGYATDQLSTAITDAGDQWTLEATGPRSFALALKDTTTVHWTVTAGAPGVELDLSHDSHERIDAVYASGTGPDGYKWFNNFFPDLLPYDPPDYPYADPDVMYGLGSTDASTLTGTGISDWQRRIRDLGYTSLAVDGVMGSADIAAVYWIQRKRGILANGVPGPQTWAATWNIGAVGGDLTTVRLPMAWRPEVEQYLYGANGAVVGNNPDYDPSIIRHEIDVDFGAGVTKEQGREMAQRILERGMDPGITGTVRLTTCPWEGSRWEMNAGENVLIKGFRGGDVLCRIVDLHADPESLTVTLTLDSEHRDAMAVLQTLDRNRESRPDPARRPGNPAKRSRLDQDMVTPFEGESPAGRLPRMALFGGLWTVWPVPVSEVGEIARMTFRTTGPASKFCVALYGSPITANQQDALVPAPLTDSAPWDDNVDTLLDRYGWIETFGKDGQAAGYHPRQESDGGAVTGRLDESSAVQYVSQKAPWVWVAMWSPVSCYIEGRIYPAPVQ